MLIAIHDPNNSNDYVVIDERDAPADCTLWPDQTVARPRVAPVATDTPESQFIAVRANTPDGFALVHRSEFDPRRHDVFDAAIAGAALSHGGDGSTATTTDAGADQTDTPDDNAPGDPVSLDADDAAILAAIDPVPPVVEPKAPKAKRGGGPPK